MFIIIVVSGMLVVITTVYTFLWYNKEDKVPLLRQEDEETIYDSDGDPIPNLIPILNF